MRRCGGKLFLLFLLLKPAALRAELDEAFEKLKACHVEDLAAIRIPLKKLFAHRLETLEKDYLAAGRYEDVLAGRAIVRAFRESVGEEVWEAPLTLSFFPEEAELVAVRLENGFLSGWQAEGAAANWKMPGLPPGGYEVWLEHTPVKSGVEMRLSEAHYFIQKGLTEGKGDDGYQRSLLGNLKVTQGSGRLTLSLGAGAPSALKVRALTLISHAP